MKRAYPVIFTNTQEGFVTYIPDFKNGTQGQNLVDAIEMSRDVLGLVGIVMQDDGEDLPTPSPIENITCDKNSFVSYVDIDFDEYRRKDDLRAVRRNVSLPSWLDNEAKKAGVNVSAVLQNALKKELKINK